ncbi:MAG: signal peptidase, partial [Pirellulales bacterium]|nr:signal peptidase [Pirellulales bacterium]
MPKFVVRYGTMRILGVFEASDKQSLGRGMKVIARTDRGLETGEILAEATPECLARLEGAPEGQILREMTADDTREFNHIHERRGEQLATCQKCIDKLGLAMELVDLEHLFGGERIVVYYLAEGRVDFRELVRMLAGEFQTRIEMRQIGVRDEAKL